MPKFPFDYSKCVMYKIVCKDLNIKDCYVGHTTDLIRRRYAHKSSCNNENCEKYNFKIYQKMREYGGFDNWSIIEIEKFPCGDFNEACARERYWLETLEANLNSVVPNRTKKEFNKLYYNQNKEQIKKLKQIKHECECGGHYTTSHKASHLKCKKHQKYLEEQQQNDPQINSNLNI